MAEMDDLVERLKALDDASGYLQPEIGEAIAEITRLRRFVDGTIAKGIP